MPARLSRPVCLVTARVRLGRPDRAAMRSRSWPLCSPGVTTQPRQRACFPNKTAGAVPIVCTEPVAGVDGRSSGSGILPGRGPVRSERLESLVRGCELIVLGQGSLHVLLEAVGLGLVAVVDSCVTPFAQVGTSAFPSTRPRVPAGGHSQGRSWRGNRDRFVSRRSRRVPRRSATPPSGGLKGSLIRSRAALKRQSRPSRWPSDRGGRAPAQPGERDRRSSSTSSAG